MIIQSVENDGAAKVIISASLYARFFWTIKPFYCYPVHTKSLNRFRVHSERSWCTLFLKSAGIGVW